ncbi:hypothetical protein O3P69_017242 [Scylla paramamosain]|uniref:Uncharacterized protein n=1 Tax=Scylla paramamosain TaxID=85552 RepID=A0AAW0TY81_SCYPA
MDVPCVCVCERVSQNAIGVDTSTVTTCKAERARESPSLTSSLSAASFRHQYQKQKQQQQQQQQPSSIAITKVSGRYLSLPLPPLASSRLACIRALLSHTKQLLLGRAGVQGGENAPSPLPQSREVVYPQPVCVPPALSQQAAVLPLPTPLRPSARHARLFPRICAVPASGVPRSRNEKTDTQIVDERGCVSVRPRPRCLTSRVKVYSGRGGEGVSRASRATAASPPPRQCQHAVESEQGFLDSASIGPGESSLRPTVLASSSVILNL